MLAALEANLGIVTKAAKDANIARSAHYDWMITDPVYKSKVEELSNVALDHVESKLFEKIDGVKIHKGFDDSGEPIVYDVPPSDTALIFYLKTKGKNRGYVERSEQAQVTKDGEDVDISTVKITFK
jgi:hypothetical protein